MSSVGEPEVKLLFNAMILSASEIVSEFTVVVVPETVKLPETVSESLTATTPVPFALRTKFVSVLLDSIASTSIEFENDIAFPSDYDTFLPAVICTPPFN